MRNRIVPPCGLHSERELPYKQDPFSSADFLLSAVSDAGQPCPDHDARPPGVGSWRVLARIQRGRLLVDARESLPLGLISVKHVSFGESPGPAA